MNFLKKIFENKQNTMENWKHITEENQLESIRENSKSKPTVIFKDSVTCGISAHAKHKLESAWDFENSELDFYYLDLLSYRNISNKIAQDFGVTHQSPQILVLKDSKVIDHFSHQSISVERIRKAI
jgi:bacillithiol system protein YtxJ